MNTDTANKIFVNVVNMVTPPMVKQAAKVNDIASAAGATTDTALQQTANTIGDTIPSQPSYFDTLTARAKDLYGQGMDWWKGLTPAAKQTAGDIGLGTAGALGATMMLQGIPSFKKNKLLKAMALISGAGLGIAANRYIQDPAFAGNVNSAAKTVANKATDMFNRMKG